MGPLAAALSPLVPLAVLVFFAELCVVTLATLRIIFISRGKRLLAPLVGFFEVTIWLFAIGQVMRNLTDPLCYLGFAAGSPAAGPPEEQAPARMSAANAAESAKRIGSPWLLTGRVTSHLQARSRRVHLLDEPAPLQLPHDRFIDHACDVKLADLRSVADGGGEGGLEA